MPQEDWEITPYRGEDGLQRLEADWRRLYDELPYRAAFHTFGATNVYLRHLSPSPETFTCFALSDGRTVRAICPLELTKQTLFGRPVSAWSLPHNDHWPITDVLCPDEGARAQLVRCLVQHLEDESDSPSLLVLGPAPEYSALWQGVCALRPTQYCVHLAWESDVIDCTLPFRGLPSSPSSGLSRARRALAKHEDVRFVSADCGPELEVQFDAFLAVEASGWKGAGGTGSAILCDPRLVAYYRDLIATLAADGQAQVNGVYAGGRCMASELCVRGREDFAVLKTGYDEAYARVAPGKLLFERTLEQCCDDDSVRRLNGLTRAPWLRDWQPETAPIEQGHLAIGRYPGRILVALFRLQWFARRILHAVRARRDRAVPSG